MADVDCDELALPVADDDDEALAEGVDVPVGVGVTVLCAERVDDCD